MWPPEREIHFWFVWTLKYIYSHTNTYTRAYIIYMCVCVPSYIFYIALENPDLILFYCLTLNMLLSFYVFNYKTCVYETKKDGKYLLNWYQEIFQKMNGTYYDTFCGLLNLYNNSSSAYHPGFSCDSLKIIVWKYFIHREVSNKWKKTLWWVQYIRGGS